MSVFYNKNLVAFTKFRNRLCFFLALVAGICLTACNKGSETIGLNLQNNLGEGVFFTDTLTVLAATVQSDSINTLNSDKILVGRYVDPYTGVLQAGSYFNLYSNGFKPDTKAVFDSLTLTLRYNYTYADTTQPQTINVFRLTQPLDNIKTYYYTTDTAAYNHTPVGKIRFNARPRSGKPVIIRLDDSWGNEILSKSLNDQLQSQQAVTDYMKGIALLPDATDNAAVLGFRTTGDSAAVKLYYHVQDLNAKTAYVQNFNIDTRFNSIRANRQQTPWRNLTRNGPAIPSKLTNEELFLQSGTNVYIRLDFPYLKNLNLGGKVYVNAAEMVVNPVDASLYNKTFTLPSSLQLYRCNSKNQIIGSLSSPQEGSGFPFNDVNLNDTYYVFSLTQHIYEQLNLPVATGEGLLVAIPASSGIAVTRLVAGSNQNRANRIKLRLYYSKP